MNIVEGQQLVCASFSGVCCPMPLWMPRSVSRDASDRPEFHRAEFIETHNMVPRRRPVVESQNAVYSLELRVGDSFHVFIRWRVIPSRRGKRRIHSLKKS